MSRWFLTFWCAAFIACCALIGAGARAQLTMTGVGGGFGAAAPAGCSQATTFLARTSLTGSDVTNYTNLICGMVTDGLITGDLSTTGCGSLFDALYIFATKDQATAILNICSTNFTVSNTFITFTAYSGFAGDSTSGHLLNTNFNPSTATSPTYVQNSAHVSIWNLTNGTDGNPAVDGQTGGETFYPKFSDNNIYARINDSPASGGFAITDPRGLLLGNRSSSTARQLYQNASTTLNGGTAATYGSQSSGAVNNSSFLLLSNTSWALAEASIGASLSSTQVTNFYNRLRTYMTAVGVP